MNPKKGEILLTTGLFDPVMSGKPVRFITTVKEKRAP
jgi:cell shape-determining protein MreC